MPIQSHDNPLVTIITVTSDLINNGREHHFRQCLESVRGQTYKNIEHIVIDAASNDGTLDIIGEYASKGWIVYVSEPDRGIFDAMNKGIKRAKGKYIAFLNSDDYYHDPDGIAASINALETSGAVFSFAPSIIIDPVDSLPISGHPHFSPKISDVFFELPFCHQSMLARKEVLIREGLFNPEYKIAGDYDLIIRLCLKKYSSVFVNKPFVTFRFGGISDINKTAAINEVVEAYYRNYNKITPICRKECKALYLKKLPCFPLKLAEKLRGHSPYFHYEEFKRHYIPKKTLYLARDLIYGEDGEFIRSLYLNILKRQPDRSGFLHYLNLLKNRVCSRIEIISFVLNSDEGQMTGVRIADLWIGLFHIKLMKHLKLLKITKLINAALTKTRNLFIHKETVAVKEKTRVLISGTFNSATGYGFAARNYAEQLRRIDSVELHLKNLHEPYADNIHCDLLKNNGYSTESDYYDFHIIVSSPHEGIASNYAGQIVWCFYWETASLFRPISKILRDNPGHIIVSPSHYMKEILENNGLKNNFFKVRHWHDKKTKTQALKDKIEFYTIAQDVHRKNLRQTVACFVEEFKNTEDAVLNLKISRYCRDLKYWKFYVAGIPQIQLITDCLTDEQIKQLHQTSDIFYLAQHSEGYGAPHIDSLHYGNQLVTNNYGALKDYLTDDNSFLIPYYEDAIGHSDIYENENNYYAFDSKWAHMRDADIKNVLRHAYESVKQGKMKKSELNLSIESTKKDWHQLLFSL